MPLKLKESDSHRLENDQRKSWTKLRNRITESFKRDKDIDAHVSTNQPGSNRRLDQDEIVKEAERKIVIKKFMVARRSSYKAH
jgi:hypothetical protein